LGNGKNENRIAEKIGRKEINTDAGPYREAKYRRLIANLVAQFAGKGKWRADIAELKQGGGGGSPEGPISKRKAVIAF